MTKYTEIVSLKHTHTYHTIKSKIPCSQLDIISQNSHSTNSFIKNVCIRDIQVKSAPYPDLTVTDEQQRFQKKFYSIIQYSALLSTSPSYHLHLFSAGCDLHVCLFPMSCDTYHKCTFTHCGVNVNCDTCSSRDAPVS